jgi:hypothetical protein
MHEIAMNPFMAQNLDCPIAIDEPFSLKRGISMRDGKLHISATELWCKDYSLDVFSTAIDFFCRAILAVAVREEDRFSQWRL